jgi:hypothetical protein
MIQRWSPFVKQFTKTDSAPPIRSWSWSQKKALLMKWNSAKRGLKKKQWQQNGASVIHVIKKTETPDCMMCMPRIRLCACPPLARTHAAARLCLLLPLLLRASLHFRVARPCQCMQVGGPPTPVPPMLLCCFASVLRARARASRWGPPTPTFASRAHAETAYARETASTCACFSCMLLKTLATWSTYYNIPYNRWNI